MRADTVKRYLPWVVATALFMEQLDSTIVNTAVPAMAASLQVIALSLKAVVTSYILSLAVCIPVSGWIADRFGSVRFGSVRFGSVRFGSVRFGSVREACLASQWPFSLSHRCCAGFRSMYRCWSRHGFFREWARP